MFIILKYPAVPKTSRHESNSLLLLFTKMYRVLIIAQLLEEYHVTTRVEPDTRLKRVSGTDKALLLSTSIIRVIRVNICARIK